MKKKGFYLPVDEPSPMSLLGKNYLFVIGIDEYVNWEDLKNCKRDVTDFSRMLTRHYQFQEENVITLFNEQATERNIRNTLRHLISTLTKEDNLIVYYSGHGHWDPVLKEGFWVPVDGNLEDASGYISNGDIVRNIYRMEALHILLLMDSCFSGTLLTGFKSSFTRSEKYSSRRVFTSGREEVVEGVEGENSPFAKGILTFLEKEVDKATRTSTLIEFVREYVEKHTQQTPVEGRLTHAKDENGEFVFYRKITESEIWKMAREKHTVEWYEKYLEMYPQGEYVKEAKFQIHDIRDDEAWAKANQNSTPDHTYAYMFEFPNGKHITEAKERLEKMDKQLKERRKAVEEVMNIKEELDHILEQYENIIEKADDCLNRKQFRKAHEQYWEAKKIFVEGYDFTPGIEYVDKKIEECYDLLRFTELRSEGEQAFARKNYAAAKQLLRKALEIQADSRLAGLVDLCNEKIFLADTYHIICAGEDLLLEKKRSEALQCFNEASRKLKTPPKNLSSIKLKECEDRVKQGLKLAAEKAPQPKKKPPVVAIPSPKPKKVVIDLKAQQDGKKKSLSPKKKNRRLSDLYIALLFLAITIMISILIIINLELI